MAPARCSGSATALAMRGPLRSLTVARNCSSPQSTRLWAAAALQRNNNHAAEEITPMKTKLLKSIMAPLVVACAFVAATVFGQGTQGGRLQGTWEMRVSRTDCAGHVIRTQS